MLEIALLIKKVSGSFGFWTSFQNEEKMHDSLCWCTSSDLPETFEYTFPTVQYFS